MPTGNQLINLCAACRAESLLLGILQEFDGAKADLREASRLDPKSKEIRDMFKTCQEKAADAKKEEKAMMAKMFG